MPKKIKEEIKKESKAGSQSKTGKPDKPSSSSKLNRPSTLLLESEHDIAYDFAIKTYKYFSKLIKSIVLFGSAAKGTAAEKSDIDIINIVDDCTVQWDDELIAWYREELGKLIKANPYKRNLHINTVRLSTWWNEMIRGEPVVVNIIRFGEALIDFGGFFNPLKVLLAQGKIKNTPETIYITLGRTPQHLVRCKAAMFNAVEAIYWAFVDAAHAALMASKQIPPSPEKISEMLREEFIKKGMLNAKYADWYEEIYKTTHKILHGEIMDVKGKDIDVFRERADEFIRVMAELVDKLTK